MKKASFTIILILFLDQFLKFWVKTNMLYNQSISVFDDWFYLHFIENPGMAFGMEYGGEIGKLILSIFRIIAVCFLFYGLNRLIKRTAPAGFIVSVSLIIGGALGNIIDSTLYGILFSESSHVKVAEFLPKGNGYAGIFQGRVVDMFYFPLIEGTYPEWFPFWPNESFVFFRPVFNIADSAITIGIFIIIFNQKKYFAKEEEENVKEDEGNGKEKEIEHG
ncbi:MAG: lipoprotein signal peptidase [Flavobacteriales bacterium]